MRAIMGSNWILVNVEEIETNGDLFLIPVSCWIDLSVGAGRWGTINIIATLKLMALGLGDYAMELEYFFFLMSAATCIGKMWASYW